MSASVGGGAEYHCHMTGARQAAENPLEPSMEGQMVMESGVHSKLPGGKPPHTQGEHVQLTDKGKVIREKKELVGIGIIHWNSHIMRVIGNVEVER